MPTFFRTASGTRNVSISKCSANKHLLYISWLSMIFIGSFTSCVTNKNIDFQALKPASINIGEDFNNIYIYCKYINRKDLSVSGKSDIIPFASVKFSKQVRLNLEKTPQAYKTKLRILDNDNLLNFKIKSPGIVILADSIRFDQVKKVYRNDWMYGVACHLGYSVYSKSRSVLVKKSIKKDTIWYKHTYLENGLSIYDRLEASIIVCEQAAEECANYIVPHWQDKSRKYYYHPGDLAKAFKLIQRSELDNAIGVLEKYYYKKANDHKCQMKALYNMAIVYELKDNVEKAYALADSSLKIMTNAQSKEYCNILYKRKLDKEVLDWQMK